MSNKLSVNMLGGLKKK